MGIQFDVGSAGSNCISGGHELRGSFLDKQVFQNTNADLSVPRFNERMELGRRVRLGSFLRVPMNVGDHRKRRCRMGPSITAFGFGHPDQLS